MKTVLRAVLILVGVFAGGCSLAVLLQFGSLVLSFVGIGVAILCYWLFVKLDRPD